MDLNFSTNDTTKLATMPVPEFVEDVAEKPAEGDPDTGDLPETETSKVAKQAVEDAPAGAAKEPTQAEKDAEAEAARAKEADKEHNFALLRATNKRLEAERDEAMRLANEAKAAEAPKLEEPPDLATMDEQIAALRAEAKRLAEEWPDMGLDKAATLNADLLQGMRNRIARDEQAIKEYQEAERRRADEAARDELAAAQEVADKLVDANPVLSHWKAKDPVSYDLAVQRDAILRVNPEWQGVPMDKRFSAVVEIVKALNPNVSLPEPVAEPQKSAAAPAKAADPVKAKGPAAPIRSLSDVPGGLTPAASELENVMEKSPAAVGNMFLKMTEEQRQEWLAANIGVI